MSQSAISNRVANDFGPFKNKELDLQTKLSIQAKQNALPQVTFGPPKQALAADLEKLREKYTVLKPKKPLVSPIVNTSLTNKNAEPSILLSPNSENRQRPLSSKDGIPEAKRNLFPMEKVINRWKENARLLSGLVNMGNTCFLNSSLQCLLHTPALYNILVSLNNNNRQDQMKFDSLTALSKLLRHAQNSGPKHPVHPSEIVHNIKRIGSHFTHGRQECAHEFTRLFMDSLLKSSAQGRGKLDKYEETTTIPHRIFGGWFRSRVTCLNCKHNSDTYESFLDMPLEIKNCETLYHCLQKFTRAEVLDESNKYKCEKCRQTTRATKQFTIHRSPNVLSICLKRFSIMGSKLSYDVRYQNNLKINKYCSNPQVPQEYELYAILVHSGFSVNSGHYYSYCKTARGVWAKFDDCTVTAVSPGNVLMQQPYMLYYRRISQNPLLNRSPSLTPPISITSKPPLPMSPSPKKINLEPSRFSFNGAQRPTPPSPNNKFIFSLAGKSSPSNGTNHASKSLAFPKSHSTSSLSKPSHASHQKVNRSLSMSSTLQHLKKERVENVLDHIVTGPLKSVKKTPEKARKVAILSAPSDALSRISNYSSSDEEPTTESKSEIEKMNDDLMESFKKRAEKKRKRKFHSEGGFWGLGKAPKWEGKENDVDKRDQENSEMSKSSIISKEQLEIDQGKVKKIKSEKKFNPRPFLGNQFQREQLKQFDI